MRPIDADAVCKRCRKSGAICTGSDCEIPTMPTLTPPNEWVSAEERLPKYNIREDGELISSKILCYCETDKTVHLVVSQKFYTGRKGEIVNPVFRYYDEWGDEIENVSHWMPLPAAPDKNNNVLAKAPNEPLTLEQLRVRWKGCDSCKAACWNCSHNLLCCEDNDEKCHSCFDQSRWEYNNYRNYCPECGRPLTDGAWVQLAKRLEGLKDAKAD